MKNLVNMLLSVFCIGALLFFCFGFLSTFEPIEQSVQITWRIVYGIAALLAVAGLILLSLPRRKANHSAEV